MRRFLLPVALLAIGALLTFASFAASTVYVDGVGTDADCYATLAEATAAVDNGGTVVLKANTTTPASDLYLSKGVTITSDSTVRTLSLGRNLHLGGDTAFESVKIKTLSTSTDKNDSIFCHGHDLTIGKNVSRSRQVPAPAIRRFMRVVPMQATPTPASPTRSTFTQVRGALSLPATKQKPAPVL